MMLIKKLFIVIILLSLFGCGKPEAKINMMVPMGSPLLSVLGLDDSRYLIDVVNGPDPLIAALGSGSHEAIIAPTNLGAKFYQSSDTYLFAGVIGLGNYYLVSTTFMDDDIMQLHQKDIIVFGQNQTSDIIIKHILDHMNIQSSFNYVDSLTSAVATFLIDPSQIVLVAEPSLSLIQEQLPQVIAIDLNSAYEAIHEGLSFPQASLFVHKNVSQSSFDQLIEDMIDSVDYLESETEDAAQKGVEWKILSDHDVLLQAIPRSHITFIRSSEATAMMRLYFEIILSMNPALIGGSIPDSDFYWE